MSILDLPENVRKGLSYINSQPEYHERFKHDPILDELDEEELDLDECHKHLKQIFRGEYEVEGVKLKPLTIAVWSWLWSTSSPFVRQTDEAVKVEDLDRFFYLLDHGVKEDGEQLGYCLTVSTDPEKLLSIISTIIKDAFSPLKMLPGTGRVVTVKSEIIYDAAWLVSIVSAVHRLSGASQDEIFHKMPMMLALHYYVQSAKENGVKNIGRRTAPEIAKAKEERYYQLLAEWLAELKVIREDEEEKYVQIMMRAPEEEAKKE